jgi:hypothetical protein
MLSRNQGIMLDGEVPFYFKGPNTALQLSVPPVILDRRNRMSSTEHWVPLDFTFADIATSPQSQATVLIVKGNCRQSATKLAPATYVTKPEYWRIDVLRDASGDIFLPVRGPFEIELPLDEYVGSRGVEIIGNKRKLTIDI